MTADPAIDEIREIRHKISESVNHDPKELVKYYIRLQENDRDRLMQEIKPEPNSITKNSSGPTTA